MKKKMTDQPVSSKKSPIAITGASDYIDSQIVQDCIEHGYVVHVRER